MSSPARRSYLGEYYWPGVSDEALAEMIVRACAATAELRRLGKRVDLRGTILVRIDETIFCLFDGDEPDVRAAAELAGIAFERVLESVWIAT
jgi:hypothetical protein